MGIIQQLVPDEAAEIISKANTGLDITIANVAAQEFKDRSLEIISLPTKSVLIYDPKPTELYR